MGGEEGWYLSSLGPCLTLGNRAERRTLCERPSASQLAQDLILNAARAGVQTVSTSIFIYVFLTGRAF